MLAVFKRQQFEGSGSEKTELRGSKHQQLYARNNEKRESLDKFENEGEGEVIRYVPLLFIALPQKESNCLTDMGEETKSLNHLI